jgi:hypothetical protein
MSAPGTPKILIDDPFAAAVANYERKAAVQQPIEEPPKPPSKEREYEERIARLEASLEEQTDLLAAVLASLNGATIECSEGSVVLTLPDLPEAP